MLHAKMNMSRSKVSQGVCWAVQIISNWNLFKTCLTTNLTLDCSMELLPNAEIWHKQVIIKLNSQNVLELYSVSISRLRFK